MPRDVRIPGRVTLSLNARATLFSLVWSDAKALFFLTHQVGSLKLLLLFYEWDDFTLIKALKGFVVILRFIRGMLVVILNFVLFCFCKTEGQLWASRKSTGFRSEVPSSIQVLNLCYLHQVTTFIASISLHVRQEYRCLFHRLIRIKREIFVGVFPKLKNAM